MASVLGWACPPEQHRVADVASAGLLSQVAPGAGRETIRAAYRDAARSLHPDKCPAPGAKDAFQRLYEAYTNLRGFVG